MAATATASAGDDMKEMLSQKAHELFALCDRENKGFICKLDMQRMIQELPLEPEQLEDVFDSLDVDKNGFLTLEEFTEGFGSFLGLGGGEESDDSGEDAPHSSERRERTGQSSEDARRKNWREEEPAEEEDEEGRYADFILHAGAAELVGESDDSIQQMWRRLQRDPESGGVLLETFSRLLADISARLRQARSEQESLEGALRQQQDTMQLQMKNMFEEMEAQIAAERTKNTHEEEQKQQKIRQDLESQVAVKELEVQMARQKLSTLTQQLEKLTSSDAQQRQENAQLQKQKDQYEDEVVRQQRLISELQAALEQTRSSGLEERRKRALAAFSVTENIASEREDLVKQLDMLKTINSRLMDERDSGLSQATVNPRQSQSESLKDVQDQISMSTSRQMEDEATTRNWPTSSLPHINQTDRLQVPDTTGRNQSESDYEVDEVFYENNPDVVQRVPVIPLHAGFKGPLRLQPSSSSLMDELLEGSDVVNPLPSKQDTREGSEGSETDDQHVVSRHHRKRGRSHNNDRQHSSTLLIYHQGQKPRGTDQPDSLTNGLVPPRSGSPTPSAASTIIQPQRVYKVVIIGDAGVGKSSFVQRFCTGHVRPSYAATIGVDFQVQTVVVEDQTVCMQLWDTAGQERFRSITKQYFRKADGVFIMFDVTTETSFRNCRQWIQNVKDLAAEETCLILVGNKTDLCPDPSLRVVKPTMAAALAGDCGAIYHECSALQDVGVTSVVELMAELLLQKEDVSLQMALRLEPEAVPKKKCCKK